MLFSSSTVTRLFGSATSCKLYVILAEYGCNICHRQPCLVPQGHSPRLVCTASASGAAAADDDGSSSRHRSSEPATVIFSPLEQKVGGFLKTLTNFFPLWVVLAAVVAYHNPPLFTWFDDSLVKLSLMFCMLAMGLTLTFQEIAGVFTRAPQLLLLGMVSAGTR